MDIEGTGIGKVWDDYGGTEYSKVTDASAKKELDLKLAALVTSINKDNVSGEPTRVAELACGRAPVSTILEKFNEKWIGKDNKFNPLFETIGFDNSDEGMSKDFDTMGGKISFKKANISDPCFADDFIRNGGAKFDTVVLENAWYAVTTGIEQKSHEESIYRRWAVLYNAWKLLEDNGTVIISDPLSSTKELGIKNTIQGAYRELKAAVGRGELTQSIQNIKNPETVAAIARNKNEILPNSHLFSFEEMSDFINKSGLFTIEKSEKADYMGHNATLVLRKINNPDLKVNGTYTLNILDSAARKLLENFRKKNYSEKINPIVTGIDGQDSKHDESITVIASITGTNIPGGIATLDVENDYNNDSWEFAELFKLPEDFEKILPENRKTGEIRRLGTISAYGPDFQRLGVESIKRVIERIYQEIYDKNLGVLFFTATPDRVRLFNGIIRNLGLKQFEEVEGVDLNRENTVALRTIITGAKYFLTEEGYSKLEENETLSKIRKYLIGGENKDKTFEEAVSALWPDQKELKTQEVIKEIQDLEKYPTNVSLFCVQVPKDKVEVKN
ncbi:MAG: hypothetical protein AB9915_01015 [Candidatus Dojkabacteria bacterium]